MKHNDKELVKEMSLREAGIKEMPCHRQCGGKYVFQRVINASDKPYSIVVCEKCGFEIYSQETVREKQLVDYANEMFMSEDEA